MYRCLIAGIVCGETGGQLLNAIYMRHRAGELSIEDALAKEYPGGSVKGLGGLDLAPVTGTPAFVEFGPPMPHPDTVRCCREPVWPSSDCWIRFVDSFGEMMHIFVCMMYVCVHGVWCMCMCVYVCCVCFVSCSSSLGPTRIGTP